MLTLFYHISMTLLVLLLLWSITKKKQVGLLRLFGFAVVGFLGAVFLGLGNFNLTAHGLAWYGGFFLFASAWIVVRQKVEGQRRFVPPLFLFFTGIVWIGFSVEGLLIEPYSIVVKRHVIETSKVSEPLRVVFLSDFQTDKVGKHERKTLELLKKQDTDLILWGGDYLQMKSKEHEETLHQDFNRLLREIDPQAPLGFFAVQGNQEISAWFNWMKLFDGSSVLPIKKTQTIDVGEISVTLLSVNDSFSARTFRQFKNPDRFRIIVGHAPRFSLAKQNADLLLAGHTHGGQIWIPGFGPLITLSEGLPRKWASGATRLENGPLLIVSNGTGMERGKAPRVRLNCRPDIVVIDIKPKK